jgi:hypothetical protein
MLRALDSASRALTTETARTSMRSEVTIIRSADSTASEVSELEWV